MIAISGSKSLHRLVYASRQRIAPCDLDDEIGAIVRASIRNNREVSVTGLLLAHFGHFVQALEGPTEAVLSTYGRISQDPRHEDSKILAAGPAASRLFADWNMCARRMTPADDAILNTLSQRDSFDPYALSAQSALKLLTAVRGIQRNTQLRAMG